MLHIGALLLVEFRPLHRTTGAIQRYLPPKVIITLLPEVSACTCYLPTRADKTQGPRGTLSLWTGV